MAGYQFLSSFEQSSPGNWRGFHGRIVLLLILDGTVAHIDTAYGSLSP